MIFMMMKRFIAFIAVLCILGSFSTAVADDYKVYLYGTSTVNEYNTLNVKIQDHFIAAGNTNVVKGDLPTRDQTITLIKNSGVTVLSGTGAAGKFKCSDYWFTANIVSVATTYSSTKLLYFNSSYTAAYDTDGKTICEAFVEQGVDTVIGFTGNVTIAHSSTFANYFFEGMCERSYNAVSAVNYAKAKTYLDYADVQTVKLFGKTTTTL